jgi:hypothetical protein
MRKLIWLNLLIKKLISFNKKNNNFKMILFKLMEKLIIMNKNNNFINF